MKTRVLLRLVVASVFALGCSRAPETRRHETGEAAASVAITPRAVDAAQPHASALRDANEVPTEVSKPDADPPYATAAPLSGKSIGHTSVVFKLKLEGGLEAAYKPRSKRGHDRYKGEIAAYRLGRALGLSNVPAAIPRSFDRASLARALGDGTPAALLLAEEGTPDADGALPGALIPWIPNLGFAPLERSGADWRQWLASGAIPADKRALAADLSAMLAFDYLTGNWDRWSGGNIGRAPNGRLLFIDNDAAFFAKPPPAQLRALRSDLEGVTRFSRSFVERLRDLGTARISAAMGDEAGAPLLTPAVVAGVASRASDVVQIVDRQIAKSSADAVLIFE